MIIELKILNNQKIFPSKNVEIFNLRRYVPIITKNLKIRENLRIIDNPDFQSNKMNI